MAKETILEGIEIFFRTAEQQTTMLRRLLRDRLSGKHYSIADSLILNALLSNLSDARGASKLYRELNENPGKDLMVC